MATAKKPSKATTKRRAPKPQPKMRSFKRSPETKPFFLFRLTQQTLYWLILTLFILALGVWVVYLSVKIQNIYDHVDSSNASQDSKTKVKH